MGLADLDTSFPHFTTETTEEKVSQIQDYLFILLENLRYTLSNLDERNWNPTSLSSITEPVNAKIKDLEGNVTELSITAQGLSTRVSNAEGDISSLEQTATGLTSRVTNAEGSITSLQQTATSLTSRVSSAEGNISTLTQTATSLTSRVNSAEGSISTLNQTATSLTSRISTAEGDISSLEQTSTSLRSRIMNAEGDINTIEQTLDGVAFTSSLAAGTTVINGGCITTGTIEAERIGAGTLTLGNSSVNGSVVLNRYCSIESTRLGELNINSENLFFSCNAGGIDASSYFYIDSDSTVDINASGTIDIVSDATGGITLEANGARVRLTDTTTTRVYPCFYPDTDDKIKLGYSLRRWEAVYATDGVIQTSDMRKKKQRPEKMSEYDALFKKLKPVSFEWKDKKDKKRRNGFNAQEVEAALTECGLNAEECGFIQKDADENGDYTYGLNYSWLIPVLVDKVQRIEERLNGRDKEKN